MFPIAQRDIVAEENPRLGEFRGWSIRPSTATQKDVTEANS